MPVRKFRSIEEMTAPTDPRPFDLGNLRIAARISHACLSFDRRRPLPGVHEYRSASAAADARVRWELASAYRFAPR
jgi:hypothetical protein